MKKEPLPRFGGGKGLERGMIHQEASTRGGKSFKEEKGASLRKSLEKRVCGSGSKGKVGGSPKGSS